MIAEHVDMGPVALALGRATCSRCGADEMLPIFERPEDMVLPLDQRPMPMGFEMPVAEDGGPVLRPHPEGWEIVLSDAAEAMLAFLLKHKDCPVPRC